MIITLTVMVISFCNVTNIAYTVFSLRFSLEWSKRSKEVFCFLQNIFFSTEMTGIILS